MGAASSFEWFCGCGPPHAHPDFCPVFAFLLRYIRVPVEPGVPRCNGCSDRRKSDRHPSTDLERICFDDPTTGCLTLNRHQSCSSSSLQELHVEPWPSIFATAAHLVKLVLVPSLQEPAFAVADSDRFGAIQPRLIVDRLGIRCRRCSRVVFEVGGSLPSGRPVQPLASADIFYSPGACLVAALWTGDLHLDARSVSSSLKLASLYVPPTLSQESRLNTNKCTSEALLCIECCRSPLCP